MAAATLRNEERIGLVVALAAHVGLVAWLALWRPSPEPIELPAKVSVTLSEEVAPVATTPQPSTDPAPDGAPELGEAPPPPAPLVQPEPQPAPPPRPVAKPAARPVQPPPRPVTRPVQPPRRDAIADLLARRTPPTVRPSGRPAATAPPRPTPAGRPGASSFADAFNKGIPGAAGRGQPSAQPGPAQVSSIRGSINARVRVPWNSCAVTGLDVNQLRASVTFALDKQGQVTSVNAPQVTGITDANRAQASRFGECAVKAIRTAAPYANLPVEFYDHWKTYKLNFRKE